MAQLNALPAGEWVICGTGAVPGMMGNLRHDTYVIAIGNDESYTNAVLARPDSPIFKTKGYNKDYPDVYGHPNDVKGKPFLPPPFLRRTSPSATGCVCSASKIPT